MSIGDDTYAWRRCLPHLFNTNKTYFVTFCTKDRLQLPEAAREIALASCIHGHESEYWLHCAVVMPDHVHLLMTPFPDVTLATILNGIKGSSSHRINALLGRRGKLWQRESFDHIVRSSEKLSEKADYICNNPVRAGLVTSIDDWPWLFRVWSAPEGGRAHT
jgi:REP element-mobilizing transposase RayT